MPEEFVDKDKLFEKEFWDLFKGEPQDLVKFMDEQLVEHFGSIPLIFKYLARRPDFYIHTMAMRKNLYLTPKKIPLKWVELISLGIAFALKNDYCAKVHIENAWQAGANTDEILECLLIADVMATSGIEARAVRVMEEFEAKHKEELGKTE
jgi:AhpD family alkylhydroperoxidase